MEKKTKIALSIMTVAVAALLIAAVTINANKSNEAKFTPPPFEANAQVGEVKNTSQYFGMLDLPFPNDKEKCSIGLEPMPEINDGKIRINFSSDKDNTVWVRLLVTDDDDNIVCESGVLKPGEYVEELKLQKEATSGDVFNVKILTFEPDTYYSRGSANANLKIK